MSETAGSSFGIQPDLQNQQVQLSKSDIFGVLQNDRRRCFLEILRKDGKQDFVELLPAAQNFDIPDFSRSISSSFS